LILIVENSFVIHYTAIIAIYNNHKN
jgi:hypothetical protein